MRWLLPATSALRRTWWTRQQPRCYPLHIGDMTHARFGKALRGQPLKSALAIVVFSLSSMACARVPLLYQVPRSFSVHVRNAFGPVAGLQLRVTRFRNEEFKRLSTEQQRRADPEQFIELIEERTTDGQGNAHFNLSKTGQFDLMSQNPGTQLWASVDVKSHAPPKTLELQWPTTPILATTQARGRITDGLFSSKSQPIKDATLTLNTLVPFAELASTTTNDDGTFAF